jgi:hypoxanthine phosphoribosyltransferase
MEEKKMRVGLSLMQVQLPPDPHGPIHNPDLTRKARGNQGNLEAVLRRGELNPHEKMIEVEAALLNRWKYGHVWEEYLDMPLLAHAHAALGLKELGYDAVGGVEKAGIPYAEILNLFGLEMFSIDYSHYKRNMEKPAIDEATLEKMKEKKKILLADIDFVSGKTLRTISEYLDQHFIVAQGAYIGLSEWPGIPELDVPTISEDTVNFKSFWNTCGKLRRIKIRKSSEPLPYKYNMIPRSLELFNANPQLDKGQRNGAAAAVEIARYLLHHGA